MMFYYLLSLFWNTRTMDLVYAIGALLIFLSLSSWGDLPVLHELMLYFANIIPLALLILFQPEIRQALSKISMKGKRYREISEFDRFLESISQSVYRMSEKRQGALIVLENQDPLDNYVNKAVTLGSQFSSELLESIFTTTTPLHDGAVVIRGTTILSAATILPLADDTSQLSKSMGTRHRAGLGISQLTDALVIVVSEETGKVSIARDGIMTRGVKVDRFKGILRSIFNPPKTIVERSFNPLEKLKPWKL